MEEAIRGSEHYMWNCSILWLFPLLRNSYRWTSLIPGVPWLPLKTSVLSMLALEFYYRDMLNGTHQGREKQTYWMVSLFNVCVGLGDDQSSSSKNSTNAATHKSSSISTGLEVLIVLLVLAAVVGFSVFLFKLWQKKKRQEQQARFLKLFEDDDELEVELGIRDWLDMFSWAWKHLLIEVC